MQLHYRKSGSGPPLVILHGLFGSSDNWHSLAKRWSTDFTVYTPDQRNHGSSPHESAMNYDELAFDLKSFIANTIRQPANIIGHSMGGKAAMLLASKHPDQVISLAVLDIGIAATSGQHGPILEALKLINPADYAQRRELEAALQKYIKLKPIRQLLLKNVLRNIDGSLAWKFNRDALLEHYPDLTAGLTLTDPFTGPVLFLRGAQSDYLEPTLSPELRSYFPRAQLRTINQAGHWLHAQQPAAVFDHITNFLKEV